MLLRRVAEAIIWFSGLCGVSGVCGVSGLKERSPRFRDYKVYGAVAGISFHEDIDRYAYKKGLFVLKSEGGIIRIANDEDFRPKEW